MEWTVPYIISQVLVIAMYVTLAITYYLKDRRKILAINFLGCVFSGGAFILLSAYTGLAMVFIAITRNVIFLIDEKKNGKSTEIKRKDVAILLFLYLAVIAVTIPTQEGLLSLLSVFATSLFTYSIWQKNNMVYRVLGIPVSLLWISYSFYIDSLFGMILESVILICAIVGIVLIRKKKENIEENIQGALKEEQYEGK
ncbi:MAG: YgjV family protein [Oscillospiraceae bacterium]|nr:YgjV family protein [Oscillospiraceae bacterium]